MSADLAELRQGFINVLAVIAVFALPAGIGIAAIAPLLVGVFLGDNWLDAIPLIAILAIYGTTNAMLTNTGTVFLAVGKPAYLAIISAVRVGVLIPVLTMATTESGVIGAAWTYLLVSLIFMPVIYLLLFRLIDLRVTSFIAEIWRPLTATVAMFFAVDSFIDRIGIDTGILGLSSVLLASIALGAAVYAAVLLTLWQIAGRPSGAERFVADRLSERFPNLPLTRYLG